MAITEDQRHQLYEGLVEVLGRERASTLMEHLPPVGWADVATKRDLDHLSLVTRRDLELEAGKIRHEFAEFRGGMQTEFAEFRAGMQTEFAEFRGGMQSEFATFKTDVQTEFAAVRSEMADGLAGVQAEIAAVEVRFERALREQGRTFFLGMLTANATLAGLAFAAAQLA